MMKVIYQWSPNRKWNHSKLPIIWNSLGVLIDEHLIWNKQEINMRLNCTIAMLSKPRINANFHILKTAHHSLFESHLQYGTQLWGQKDNETITTFTEASKLCPEENNLQNCPFMYQIQHSPSFPTLYAKDKHNYNTLSRSATHTIF